MSATDWSTVPITRRQHEDILDPPDLQELATSFVDEVGPSTRLSVGTVVERLRATCYAQADKSLRGLGRSEVADALPVLRQRPDYDDVMFFDFLTMQGPLGSAIQNQVVQLMTSDSNREQWLEALRDPRTPPS